MNNGIIEHPSGELIPSSDSCRIAFVDSHQVGINVPAVLGHLAQYANMANIANSIRKGVQYVVQVPTHLQSTLEAGKYTMLHGEQSGKTWATIVEKLSNGKNEFIANCPIKEEAFYQGNPMQDMSSSFANLQMQMQMAALVQMLGETYDAILRVEAGQKADRIGQLTAGRNGIIHALKMKEEESRRLQIVVARGSLQEAQSKIGEVLKQKVDSFKALPKNAVRRFINECFRDGYLDKRDDEYDAIQDYCNLYLQATRLIGESYLICKEEESAVSVFDESIKFIKSLDFSNVHTILYSHPKMKDSELFTNTAVLSITRDKALCLEAAKSYDHIEITLNGEELLEVLEHGN